MLLKSRDDADTWVLAAEAERVGLSRTIDRCSDHWRRVKVCGLRWQTSCVAQQAYLQARWIVAVASDDRLSSVDLCELSDSLFASPCGLVTGMVS